MNYVDLSFQELENPITYGIDGKCQFPLWNLTYYKGEKIFMEQRKRSGIFFFRENSQTA